MKAVILAAGKGTRMGDLAKESPKHLLVLAGKTLLAHKLDEMPDSIDEVIMVVNHLKERIIESLGDSYGKIKIRYVVQENLNGTAGALFTCKEFLKDEEKFVLMMGDDIYAAEDIRDTLATPWSMLISERDSVQGRAKVTFDEEGRIKDVLERYPHDEAGFICTGMYCLTPEIFDYEPVEIGSGEFGLPQTILLAGKSHKISPIQARFWLQVNAPEDLQIAEEYFNIKK